LRQAWGKRTAFWNKIGQSISASEKSLEVFRINNAEFMNKIAIDIIFPFFCVSLPTHCATRWNTYYYCIAEFLKNHKSIKPINGLLQCIGLTSMFSKLDIDNLQEYALLMRVHWTYFKEKINASTGLEWYFLY
jgi:hypothetical protein